LLLVTKSVVDKERPSRPVVPATTVMITTVDFVILSVCLIGYKCFKYIPKFHIKCVFQIFHIILTVCHHFKLVYGMTHIHLGCDKSVSDNIVIDDAI